MNEKYIPLYRKYRPQELEEIVGQEHIKKALANAISLDKISHAYLFTGPRGTGKTSTARIFAKSLNCVDGPTVKPCGTCSNCVDITNSTPMDVIEIDAASNRKVEDAQNILEKVMYAPVSSRFKIYIIDEVHMLSNTAFNALLKTLEEPPKNVIFILATTEVHKVLDTIKSRCQRFDFKRITTDDIVKHLRYISDTEKINITDDALFTIAKNSAGGMRDSIALPDQLSILDGKEAICTNDINNLLGRLSFDTLYSLADKIVISQPQEALEELEKIYNSGNEPVQILTNLMDYFKNLLIVKNCREEIAFELTQANDIQIKNLKSQSENVETHQIVFVIEKCAEYIKELKLTNNPRLWLEVAIIDLSNLVENTKLIELQNRISRLEGNGSSQPVNAAQYKTPPAPVMKPEIIPAAKAVSEPAMEHAKPDILKAKEAKQAEEIKIEKPKTQEVKEVKENKMVEPVDDFSPMPKAQSTAGVDLNVMWKKLLENVQSTPARSLLNQWGTPVQISPDNVVITMKNEVFLTQFVEGNKRKMLADAVDALFGQKDSKFIVRLPQPDDANLRQSTVNVQPVVTAEKKEQPKKKDEEPEPEEIEELKAEIKDEISAEENKPVNLSKGLSSMHSDSVNMVIDLFDGKMID